MSKVALLRSKSRVYFRSTQTSIHVRDKLFSTHVSISDQFNKIDFRLKLVGIFQGTFSV